MPERAWGFESLQGHQYEGNKMDSDDEQMKEALAECHFYNKMGGLTEEMMEDIAYDSGVDFKELKKEYGW